jgi:hypothetical protein
VLGGLALSAAPAVLRAVLQALQTVLTRHEVTDCPPSRRDLRKLRNYSQ